MNKNAQLSDLNPLPVYSIHMQYQTPPTDIISTVEQLIDMGREIYPQRLIATAETDLEFHHVFNALGAFCRTAERFGREAFLIGDQFEIHLFMPKLST